MSMTTEELESGLKIVKARLTEFKKTHKELRKDYLEEKLVEAVATGKTKKASDLKKKMAREENTKMWFCINRSQRDPRGKAITTV